MPKVQQKSGATPVSAGVGAGTLIGGGEVDYGSAVALSETADKVKILYVGDAGSGKTTNLAMMANVGPVIYVNAEGGLKAKPLKRLGVKIENIQVHPVPGQVLTYDYLEGLFWDLKAKLEADPGCIAGVVWDSANDITKTLLDNVVAGAVVKAESKSKDRDPFFVALEDYGMMSEQVVRLMRRFRDLPCHFGVSSLPRRDVDDDGKVVYRPGVIPSLRTVLMGYPDIVCYTSVEEIGGEDVYVGLFRPAGKYRGKDRFGVMPKRLPSPTFDRILGYVDGVLDAESDPLRSRVLALQKGGKAESETDEQGQDEDD